MLTWIQKALPQLKGFEGEALSYVENWILCKSAEWLPDLTINFLLFQITPTLTIPKKEIFQINFKNFKEQNYLSDLKK